MAIAAGTPAAPCHIARLANYHLPRGEKHDLYSSISANIDKSPRWLIDHNRGEEGLRTLARLHSNGNLHDPWVQAEYAQIQESITYEHEHEAQSYVELFTSRSSFRRLFLCCAIQASVQMTGVSAIQ